MEMINLILVNNTIRASILKLTNTWGDDREIKKLWINDLVKLKILSLYKIFKGFTEGCILLNTRIFVFFLQVTLA